MSVGGAIRVVCAQSLTVALVSPVLARWNLDRPDVTVDLRESTDPETAYALLDSGEADLLLFPDPLFDDAGFEVTTVAEEEVVVALPPRHPLASRDGIRPVDLQGQPFVHFTQENRLGSWSLKPRWIRRLVATTATPRDPIAAQFVSDLVAVGPTVPADIARQLTDADGSVSTP